LFGEIFEKKSRKTLVAGLVAQASTANLAFYALELAIAVSKAREWGSRSPTIHGL
jgi:hypothetical protein